MATERSGRDGDPSTGGDASNAGQRSDPVATENQRLAQAGGLRGGEPGAGGGAYGSGGHKGKGDAEPSGSRTESSKATPSNDVAPLVHTGMDDEVRATEEKAAKVAGTRDRSD